MVLPVSVLIGGLPLIVCNWIVNAVEAVDVVTVRQFRDGESHGEPVRSPDPCGKIQLNIRKWPTPFMLFSHTRGGGPHSPGPDHHTNGIFPHAWGWTENTSRFIDLSANQRFSLGDVYLYNCLEDLGELKKWLNGGPRPPIY